MMNGQGRKARNDRYYQTNRDEKNRRRREKRQREKEQRLLGMPRLKLVDRSAPSPRTEASDLETVLEHSQTSGPERATDLGQVSDQSPTSEPGSTSDHRLASGFGQASGFDQASGFGQALDLPTLDHESGAGQTSDRDQLSNCDESQFCLSKGHDESNCSTPFTIQYQEIIMPLSSARAATVYRFPADEKKSKVAELLKKLVTLPSLIYTFQVSVICGLGILSTFLQYEFYRQHDILPGYSWPLAVAGSLAMIALLTLQFSGTTDWIRRFVCGGYYAFMVASTTFHVFSHTWEKTLSEPVSVLTAQPIHSVSVDPVTSALTDALQKATKAGAWSTMQGIVEKLPKPQVITVRPPLPKPLGISREAVNWVGAGILIVLRALLEAAQALCVIALKARNPLMNLKEA